MLWPILCVACGSLGGVDFAMPLWLVVTICCSAIALNVVLLTCALTKRWGALHALTWVHVATYFALWALRFELNLWVFTRLLVGLHSCWVRPPPLLRHPWSVRLPGQAVRMRIGCTCAAAAPRRPCRARCRFRAHCEHFVVVQILAVNCELQSVLSQQQLRFSPWLDRVRTLWLGRTTATDRRLYDDSIAQALNDEAPLPEAAGEAVPAERTASVPISAEPVSEGSSFQLPMPPLAPRRSAELQVAAADAVVTVHVQRGTGAPCEEGRPEGAGDRQN